MHKYVWIKPAKKSVFLFGASRNKSGQVIDSGIVLFFEGPNSYTGEDIVEFQAHGNPIILGDIVPRAVELGARQARPGEFTERSFRNGKISLDQAEAVADLIAGTNKACHSLCSADSDWVVCDKSEFDTKLYKGIFVSDRGID